MPTLSIHHLKSLVILCVLALSVAACDSGEDDPETGSVTGLITAADGETPIPGVTVSLASAQRSATSDLGRMRVDGPSAVTDTDGRFTLEGVPIGEQTLLAQRGAFQTTFMVTVEQDQQTMIDAPIKIESASALAYVPGVYDSIEEIVEELGNEITELSVSDLADPGVTSQYGIIFLNCSNYFSAPSEEVTDNLRDYVENGGVLYASDWASVFVEALYPESIEFERSGNEQTITVDVVEDDVRLFVDGRDEIELAYDLGSWARIASVQGASVLVRGTVNEEDTSEPLAVLFEQGQGQVIYTTFHNEAGVTEDQLAVLRYFIYLP